MDFRTMIPKDFVGTDNDTNYTHNITQFVGTDPKILRIGRSLGPIKVHPILTHTLLLKLDGSIFQTQNQLTLCSATWPSSPCGHR